MSLATRTPVLKNVLPTASTTLVSYRRPDSLKSQEAQKEEHARLQKLEKYFDTAAQQSATNRTTDEPAKVKVQGVAYSVWMGANVTMFSSAEKEADLLAMRTQNHWDLPISRAASRVADFLWPDCQTVVDQAVAKSKVMQNTRGVKPDDVYVAPDVPHFLPITHWVSTNDAIKSSFVCDKTTAVRPRMSWYNPNDGMVPCGWLTQGLLSDLAYYKPFQGTSKKE